MKARALPIGVALVGALAFAACGSSGSSTAASKQPAASPSTASTTGPTVEVAKNAKFGDILVDAKGMTLYTFTNGGKPVPCSGACAAAWPPLTVSSGTQPAGTTGVTGLGTTTANGDTLVTQAGLPLYRFSGDAAAGDANGDGLNSFGGLWHVVKTSAPASSNGAGAASTPTTASSSSSNGGGGYSGY
jgi:predicted lipoprotein with Yx(FWY)xxD motif